MPLNNTRSAAAMACTEEKARAAANRFGINRCIGTLSCFYWIGEADVLEVARTDGRKPLICRAYPIERGGRMDLHK
ncbi:hypothetical protein D3C84_1082920 [compost metagenome]